MSSVSFSSTYAEARHRFLDAARAVNADVHSHALDAASPDKLSIDVATLGEPHDPALVISSGIHGVEGYFGSAVQLALLQQLKLANHRKHIRYVLIHGVNPYGFARGRRVNEENVDLNRNFMLNARAYAGAPEGYARLNGLLNPASPPSPFEPFKLKMLWKISTLGLQALKQSVAGGQYEYPRGLFFGGTGACASTRIVQNNCDAWLAASPRIVHLDLHSGLGPFGTYKLLLNEAPDSQHYAWYIKAFGAEHIEPPTGETAYQTTGEFGLWMQRHFHAREYRFGCAEFGTYSVIRVLAALRAENRAHHYCAMDSAEFVRAKNELRECFCPDSALWRQRVVASALRILGHGAHALSADTASVKY